MAIDCKFNPGTIIFAVIINLVTLCLPCHATTVVLAWDTKADPTLAGYKVYYKADSAALPLYGTGATEGAAPIDVHKQTNATISGLDPAHSYYFAVTSYDSTGAESACSNVVTVPELIPPSISLTSPANNSNQSGMVSVSANASDNVGVVKVEFYVNGVLAASDTSTPYFFSWNTTPLSSGSYTLSAKAYDAAGNAAVSGNTVITVVKDVTAPTVAITTPANNAVLSGTVVVSAAATDNIGVAKVEFYVDGALRSAVNTTPYTYYWNTNTAKGGNHALSVKAYDAAGNASTSNLVAVHVISGDIDGDGSVTVSDAMIALQIAAGNVQPTSTELQRGDVAPLINSCSVPDGIVDIGDVIVILSKAVAIPAP